MDLKASEDQMANSRMLTLNIHAGTSKDPACLSAAPPPLLSCLGFPSPS